MRPFFNRSTFRSVPSRKLLIFGLGSILVSSAFGQGQVNFNNRVLTATPNPVDAPISPGAPDMPGGQLASGNSARAALLGGPTTQTPASASSPGTLSLLASPTTGATWVTFRTGTLAGYVAVGTDSARDTLMPYGSTVTLQVVAWTGTDTTWAQAWADWKAGLIAGAISFPITSGTTASPTDLNVPTLQGLHFNYIPEPSSFALFGLGTALLIILAGKSNSRISTK